MALPRLQELAVAQNSNSLTDAMSVYIERKINEDLYFVAGLSHLWEVLYSRVNEHKLLIAELNVFGGPLALQCVEFFKQLSQTKVLKMLEIRKSIAKIWMIPIRLYLLLYYVHGDDEVGTWSCNGLLLCGGSGMPVFDYVYNPSTNQYKKLSYQDFSLDNSPYYSSAGLRIAFDPIKSPYYKLVDAGRRFYDIDIQIYSSEIGKWSLCIDHFNYFNFDHFDSAIYWNDREQDSLLVIKLSRKVVQYNLISKTLHEIYDCRSNQVDDNHDDNDDDDDDELL
ncbi:hypothetical protein Tco_0734383 [Tanacetum coccineum]